MKSDIKKLTLSAVFTALIFLATLLHVGIGANGGYIHLGDAVIYIASAFLPAPFSVFSAALGACLADLVSGSAAWVLPTFIIKALTALCFSSKGKKIICARNYIACAISGVLCCAGYFFAEALIYGCGFIPPLLSLPLNLIQAVLSTVIFVIAGSLFDKSDLKSRQ